MGYTYSTVLGPNVAIFNCRMHSFSAEVPAANGDGTSDPFLSVDFDGYKSFQTSTAKCTILPQWDTDVCFNYETAYSDQLQHKSLIVFAYDENAVHENVFMGQARVDLHTLATGPSDVTLTLLNGDVKVGKVFFQIEMNEMTESVLMVSKAVVTPAHELAHRPSWWYLTYAMRSYPTGIQRTELFVAASVQPVPFTHSLYLGGSLYTIVTDAMYVTLWGDDGKEYASACVPIDIPENATTLQEGRCVLQRTVGLRPSQGQMTLGGLMSAVVATLSIELKLSGMPKMAQMSGGRTIDGIVQAGAKSLFTGIAKPKNVQSPEDAAALARALPTEPHALPTEFSESNEPPRLYNFDSRSQPVAQYSAPDYGSSGFVPPPPQVQSAFTNVYRPSDYLDETL